MSGHVRQWSKMAAKKKLRRLSIWGNEETGFTFRVTDGGKQVAGGKVDSFNLTIKYPEQSFL